jgi:hypothetical protein
MSVYLSVCMIELHCWQQLDPTAPIVVQQWDLRSHQSKNDLRSLWEDTVVEQWFGLPLVQEWSKTSRWPCITLVQERAT